MKVKLREYQERAVADIRYSYRTGHKAPLLVLPTGGGKTVVFSHIMESAAAKESSAYLLVHRQELLLQASRHLYGLGVTHGRVAPGHSMTKDRIQVASVQTLVKRLDRYPAPDLLVIDECFPAGTLIDGQPIESIKTGDLVQAFNHELGRIESRPVVDVMKRNHTGSWVKVITKSGASFVCTDNHPIYTIEHGYIPAAHLLLYGDSVTLLRYEVPELSDRNAGSPPPQEPPVQILQHEMSCRIPASNYRSEATAGTGVSNMRESGSLRKQENSSSSGEDGSSLLLRKVSRGFHVSRPLGKNAQNQFDIPRGYFKENERSKSHERPESYQGHQRINEGKDFPCQGREWSVYKTANGLGRGDGISDGAPCGDGVSRGQVREPASLLQSRPRRPVSEAGDRGRWEVSFDEKMEVPRRAKDSGPWLDGLDCVEVYERGSEFRPSWVPCEDTVYNLHVEGLHNYFAAGVLVHNCHHSVAGSWRKVIEAYQPHGTRVLGVTATPRRLDGNGLGVNSGGVYDDIIIGPSVSGLIGMGFLTRPVVYAPSHAIDLSGVAIRAGDYDKGELKKRVDKPSITGDAVDHYRKICSGVPAIAFCASVEHSQNVAEAFRAAGYRALSLDGTMSDAARKDAIDALGSGRLDVLSSCEIISEGTDVPVVGAVILLRPTASESLFLQQVGRGLRPYAGKEHTIILDHAGNTLKHGFPDDDREWSLEGQPKKKKDIEDEENKNRLKVRQCPDCYRVHKFADACPSCGHVYFRGARELDEVEGELKQIDPEARRLIAKARQAMIDECRTLQDFQDLARRLGYKSGWAYYEWKKKTSGRVAG